MRIILFAGKGGVGKTSVAAATGLKLARAGKKTLVMSLDPAHSLSDSFDLGGPLIHHGGGGIVPVDPNLDIQELDVLEEVERHWGEVHAYVSVLMAGAGIDEVLADELAIIPGMEETSLLLYINQYHREKTYDYLILDCAPTAESLRFISFPSILRWYMQHLWRMEKNLLKVARPILKRVTDVPLPGDAYFENLRRLFEKIDGVDQLLTNHKTTTVRLVTNPEKMVVHETQRAYMYFSLYGLLVDGIVLNRMLPGSVTDPYFERWHANQTEIVSRIHELFQSVPILEVPLMPDEVLGRDRLVELGDRLYRDQDPGKAFSTTRPFVFRKQKNRYVLTVQLPFLTSEEIDLARAEDQLVIRVGGFKRHIPLPRGVPSQARIEASLDQRELTICFR